MLHGALTGLVTTCKTLTQPSVSPHYASNLFAMYDSLLLFVLHTEMYVRLQLPVQGPSSFPIRDHNVVTDM